MIKEPWTPEDDAILARAYPFGIDVAHAALKHRTRAAVMTRAKQKRIKVRRDVIANAQRRSAALMRATQSDKRVERRPFDDLPPEYIKVPSIWRVGQRCLQGAA